MAIQNAVSEDTQADLNLHLTHISKGRFSDIADIFIY